MRVRIERKLNLKCAAMTELYIDGKREYVAEITPDASEINIPVHMESKRIWIEFEADVEVLEKRTDYGTAYRVAMVRDIHDCV